MNKDLEDILEYAWQFAEAGLLIGVVAYVYRPVEVFASLLPVAGIQDWAIRVLFEANLN